MSENDKKRKSRKDRYSKTHFKAPRRTEDIEAYFDTLEELEGLVGTLKHV